MATTEQNIGLSMAAVTKPGDLFVGIRFCVEDLNDGGRFSAEDVAKAIAYVNEFGAGFFEVADHDWGSSANITNVVQDLFVEYLEENFTPIA
jgi:hypothetical protein